MNIDWGAGPIFGTEEEWNDWHQKARRVCISHHHACACREWQFTEAVRLLELMCRLSRPPQTERYRDEYLEVVGLAHELLEKVEVYPHETFPISNK